MRARVMMIYDDENGGGMEHEDLDIGTKKTERA